MNCLSSISQEQLREILEGVRRLRKRKKNIEEEDDGGDKQKEELDIAIE